MKTSYAFVFVCVCALLALPTVLSENYAAFGSRVNQAQTVTVGSTTTTSLLAQRLQVVNRGFTIVSTVGTSLQCQFYNVTFTANQGQNIYGNFTSTVPLSFYLVPDQTYQNWLKSNNCGSADNAISTQTNTQSYAFNATFTYSGPWDLVLVNSSTKDADGFLTAYLSSTGYTIALPILSTTMGSLTGVTVASTNPSIPGFQPESIVLGVLLGLAVLMALRHGRRKQ